MNFRRMSLASTSSLLNAGTPLHNVSSSGFLLLNGLQSNLAESMEQCLEALERSGLAVVPDDGTTWCNATWDSVLCWPATPADSSITLQCPPLKGLDPAKNITKFCHKSGRWMGKTADDFSRPYGWTNFTMCFTQEVVDIMRMNNGSLVLAQDIARNARKLEFVGLGLSFISLLVSVLIFSCFRRLRVFRNLLHLQLMIAILMMVVIRLILYIDLVFTNKLGNVIANPDGGRTINTMAYVCELAYFLLEYFKTVAFWWMFLAGLHLHNQLVFTFFNREPKLNLYLLAGYGIPLVHTVIWLLVIIIRKQGKVQKCLGNYYLEPDFWILDGPRMIQLVINTFFVCNVIRVLWLKVSETHNASEMDRMKKSVKAAFMLIPLLGIPNIMQTIPFTFTQENIMYFACWTYIASFCYMFQGFMISIIYCFTNREVQSVIKSYYQRYKLTHTSTNELRRGSRSIASYYQVRNGNVTTSLDGDFYRKGSSNGSPKIKVSTCSCTPRRNISMAGDIPFNFCPATEHTPLKSCLRCEEFPYDEPTTKKTSVVTFLNDVG
ncbi:Calcitonin receptor-like protein 1 [Aphelenchoides besseyi]|nr:Calcitonin receptor-like protein 1 [Aphelenchoides besseyi]